MKTASHTRSSMFITLRTVFLFILLGILSGSIVRAEDPLLITNSERTGWVVDYNYINPADQAKAKAGKTASEFAIYNSRYDSSKPLGSPLKLTVNGNSWTAGTTANLHAEIFLCISTPRENLNSGRLMTGLAARFPNQPPPGSAPIGLPGLGINGTGQQATYGLEFLGEAEGGILIDLIVTWNASISGGINVPIAFMDQEAALCKGAAESYMQEIRSEVMGYLQSLKINPAAKLVAGGPAKKPTDYLEIAIEPASKAGLLPDGRDGVTIKVRALPVGQEKPDDVARKTQSIAFDSIGSGKDWADFGEPKVDGQWKRIYVQASNPDKVRGPAKPPAMLEIRAMLKDGTQSHAKTIQLKLTPLPELDAKPDVVEFTSKSSLSAQVQVALDNPGPERWTFRTEYDKKSRPLAAATIKSTDASHAVLTLQESGLDPQHDGANTEIAVLRIFAEQKGQPSVERDIKVVVAQEGLFIANTSRDQQLQLFKVQADGKAAPTDVDFRVFAQDQTTKKIQNLTKRPDVFRNIVIECIEPETSAAARMLKAGELKWSLAGIRPSNEPSAILRLVCTKELPGVGRVVPVDFRITYNGPRDEAFTAIFTVGLVTTQNGPGGKEWQLELARCQEVINKFVPAVHRAKLQAMLDKRKMTLGAEGLQELRRKIWFVASDLILAEGARGYEDEARWANYITETLEWSEWAGDMAFGFAIGSYTGPYGALGASVLKGTIISALNAYQENQSAQEWLWGNLSTIPGILEGQVIDPDTFEKLGVHSKTKIWAIFISYHFLKNLYEGETIVDALKNTAKEAGGAVLSRWLAGEVAKNTNRPAGTPPRDSATNQTKTTPAGTAPAVVKTPLQTKNARTPAESSAHKNGADLSATSKDAKPVSAPEAQPQKPQAAATASTTKDTSTTDTPAPTRTSATGVESDSSKLVRERTSTTNDGKRYAHPDDVLTIMQDPSMVRALKDAPPEVQEAFSNTRECIYRQHDTIVVQHIKDTLPDLKYRMVKVMEFRTPGATGPSLNTDRDYRVCYYAGRDPHTGKEQWIEVPRKHWEDQSYRTFAQLTGGPTGSPAESKEWAARHQQLATDKYHMEASPAFSDQKKIWNPQTRKFENAQITSNYERVTKQKLDGVDIEDPQALGRMYEIKVADAHHPHEAFVQANKAVDALIAIRKVYNVQGRAVGVIPDRMLAGMKAVATANEKLKADPNRRDPVALAAAEKELRANGFSSLEDFIGKMSGQFESLKFMQQKTE